MADDQYENDRLYVTLVQCHLFMFLFSPYVLLKCRIKEEHI